MNAKAQTMMELMFSIIAKQVPGARLGYEFTPTPAMENNLVQKISLETNWFWQNGFLTLYPTTLRRGQRISLGVDINIARTHVTTPSNPLLPTDKSGLESNTWECDTIKFPLIIFYEMLNEWAEFGEAAFLRMYNDDRIKKMSGALIKLAWHGTSRAATSDIGANPNMEDVAIGILKKIIDWNTANPGQGVGGEDLYSTGVEIGGADFEDLDELVTDLKYTIKEEYRNNLVLLISDNVMGHAEGHYRVNQTDKSSEKLALAMNSGEVLETYGGLKAFVPPYFPDNTLMITQLNNLFVPVQRTSFRRQTFERQEWGGIADYNQADYDYFIAEPRSVYLAQNLSLV